MKNIKSQEIWLAQFPLEEDESQIIKRPILVIDSKEKECLVVKITKHNPRQNDKFDIEIEEWQEANLNFTSTARVSKLKVLLKEDLIHKIGKIQQKDWNKITQKIEEFYGG